MRYTEYSLVQAENDITRLQDDVLVLKNRLNTMSQPTELLPSYSKKQADDRLAEAEKLLLEARDFMVLNNMAGGRATCLICNGHIHSDDCLLVLVRLWLNEGTNS